MYQTLLSKKCANSTKIVTKLYHTFTKLYNTLQNLCFQIKTQHNSTHFTTLQKTKNLYNSLPTVYTTFTNLYTLKQTKQNFTKNTKNSTQLLKLHKALHVFTQLYKQNQVSKSNYTQLFTTLFNTSITIYKISKLVQNFTKQKTYKHLQNFTQVYTTLQNYTELYTTSQNFYNTFHNST